MTDKIEPCPFCGGEARAYSSVTSCSVMCLDCGGSYEAQKPPAYLDRIIAAWNRRTPSARLEAERAVIEAAKVLARKNYLDVGAEMRLNDALAALARTEKKL